MKPCMSANDGRCALKTIKPNKPVHSYNHAYTYQ